MRLNVYKWSCLFILVLLLASFNILAQQAVVPEKIISPYLRKDKRPEGSVYLLVKDTAAFKAWTRRHLPDIKLGAVASSGSIYRVTGLSQDQWRKLQLAPQLQFVETGKRVPHPERELTGLDLSLNSITAVHHRYPALAGDGLTVSIKENAFDTRDIDYDGRILHADQIPSSADAHATTMATIIGGAGNSSPEGKGAAWKVMLASSDFTNLLPDNTAELINDGISVQNHSYGVAIENYYGIESSQYDQQCRNYTEILHVFSAGNSGAEAGTDGLYAGITGFANLTGQFKMSKNTISVGGVGAAGVVEALSSRGPAYDGRIKPEVVAFGGGGTSDAAAVVSGIALMVQQAYKDKTGSLPPSTLTRAAIINSAGDGGRPQVDYAYGFGNADALGAVRSVLDNRYVMDDVTDGAEKAFQVSVPAGTYQLKVTLVWNDLPAEPGAAKALVNDLDLTVSPNSSTHVYKPWVLSAFPHADSLAKPARRAEDHLNNVEQVSLEHPEEGLYTVRIKGYSVQGGTQSFSVVYSVEKDLEWIFPLGSDALLSNKNTFVRWKASPADVPAKAQWRMNDTDQWQVIGDVNLSEGYFEWTTPDIDGVVKVRLLTATESFESEEFVVSHELQMRTGFNCDTDALLYWSGDAAQYRVFRFKERFMEPLFVSVDTVLRVDKSQESASYFSVAPVVGGRLGVRSRTLNYTAGSEGCYLRSFLPRELVTDSVQLDLVLAFGSGLASITLERQTRDGFVPVQTISPVADDRYTFYDAGAQPGANRYRVRITRDNGAVIYSPLEEVLYTRDEDLICYPNPVSHGETLYAIINSDVARFTIHDMTGRPVRSVMDDGEIKVIDTTGLPAGAYVIRSLTPSGKMVSRKLIIR